MTNYNIERYQEAFKSGILRVWERSVLATHDFLTRSDYEEIKELVAAIDFKDFDVYCLTRQEAVLGFIGIAENKIEMLFIDPECFGQGLGLELLSFAVKELQADQVDVNEQNSKALRFYQKFGFEVIERTDKDDQGRNYPLLRMKLKPIASV